MAGKYITFDFFFSDRANLKFCYSGLHVKNRLNRANLFWTDEHWIHGLASFLRTSGLYFSGVIDLRRPRGYRDGILPSAMGLKHLRYSPPKSFNRHTKFVGTCIYFYIPVMTLMKSLSHHNQFPKRFI